MDLVKLPYFINLQELLQLKLVKIVAFGALIEIHLERLYNKLLFKSMKKIKNLWKMLDSLVVFQMIIKIQ
jgi:hypothetical protein